MWERFKNDQRKYERGRSMLEIVAALVVGGLLLMISAWVYSVAMAKSKASEMDQLVRAAKIKIDAAAAVKKQETLKVNVLDGTPVSLRGTNGYRNVGIRIDFGKDVRACKEFKKIYEGSDEFYVYNGCDDKKDN